MLKHLVIATLLALTACGTPAADDLCSPENSLHTASSVSGVAVSPAYLSSAVIQRLLVVNPRRPS